MTKIKSENLSILKLSKIISSKLGFSVKLTENFTNEVFAEISEEIYLNNSVLIKNFGLFKILHKKDRLGRNPKTKEEFIIKAHKSISFRISDNFNKKINND
ncbi:MAG: HU family DNA-binding protein [Pelagibacteraceae bacterium]